MHARKEMVMKKKYEVVYRYRDWINRTGWDFGDVYDTPAEYVSELPEGNEDDIAYEYLNWIEDGLLDTDDYRDGDYSTCDRQYSVEFYELDEGGDRVSDDPVRTYSLWESALHKRRFGR